MKKCTKHVMCSCDHQAVIAELALYAARLKRVFNFMDREDADFRAEFFGRAFYEAQALPMPEAVKTILQHGRLTPNGT